MKAMSSPDAKKSHTVDPDLGWKGGRLAYLTYPPCFGIDYTEDFFAESQSKVEGLLPAVTSNVHKLIVESHITSVFNTYLASQLGIDYR